MAVQIKFANFAQIKGEEVCNKARIIVEVPVVQTPLYSAVKESLHFSGMSQHWETSRRGTIVSTAGARV